MTNNSSCSSSVLPGDSSPLEPGGGGAGPRRFLLHVGRLAGLAGKLLLVWRGHDVEAVALFDV